MADTLSADRIVAGVTSSRAEEILRQVYARPPAGGPQFIVTTLETAELAKAAANAFLATKISFINAMAEICEAAGGDVRVLAQILGADPRIGPAFLRAGWALTRWPDQDEVCSSSSAPTRRPGWRTGMRAQEDGAKPRCGCCLRPVATPAGSPLRQVVSAGSSLPAAPRPDAARIVRRLPEPPWIPSLTVIQAARLSA